MTRASHCTDMLSMNLRCIHESALQLSIDPTSVPQARPVEMGSVNPLLLYFCLDLGICQRISTPCGPPQNQKLTAYEQLADL